ncbi:MAG: T9SS type A sorting domain-containing protein [Bacteroidales bacterium]|nr:T9SS type A sorting domain-containing protein [Bacteroidales bacterium]
MKHRFLATIGIAVGVLLCVNSLCAQQWTTVPAENFRMKGSFITDDNTVLLAGSITTDENPFARAALVKLFSDGQYELTSFPREEDKNVAFETVFPLPNGGYFVVGERYIVDYPSKLGDLLIIILDEDLNMLSEQAFQAEDFDGFDGSRSVIDDDGTIVVMATARRPGPMGRIDYNGVLFRFTQEGEMLQCRYLVADPPDPIAYMYSMFSFQILNDPYSDRIVVLGHGKNGIESVLLFDSEFNLIEDHMIADISIPDTVIHYLTCCYRVENCRSDYWYNENEILISAHQHDTTSGVHNHPHVLVGRMNLNGEITEKVDITKQDTLFYAYEGMSYVDDTTVYVITRCHTVNWSFPYYPHVYLLSTDLEILGRVELWDDLNYEGEVIATSDGGCVLLEISGEDWIHWDPIFRRFNRDDFHPISISVKETPLSDLHANAFPNPAKDELNIDLTGLSGNEVRRIRITDTSGRPCLDRIVHGEGNLLTLCLANLPSGIYSYVVYEGKNATISGKIVKE